MVFKNMEIRDVGGVFGADEKGSLHIECDSAI